MCTRHPCEKVRILTGSSGPRGPRGVRGRTTDDMYQCQLTGKYLTERTGGLVSRGFVFGTQNGWTLGVCRPVSGPCIVPCPVTPSYLSSFLSSPCPVTPSFLPCRPLSSYSFLPSSLVRRFECDPRRVPSPDTGPESPGPPSGLLQRNEGMLRETDLTYRSCVLPDLSRETTRRPGRTPVSGTWSGGLQEHETLPPSDGFQIPSSGSSRHAGDGVLSGVPRLLRVCSPFRRTPESSSPHPATAAGRYV